MNSHDVVLSTAARPHHRYALPVIAIAVTIGLLASDALAQQLVHTDKGTVTSGMGRENKDNFGAELAAGDLNLDGKTDLLVGAPYYDDLPGDATKYGAVYVIWGPVTDTSTNEVLLVGDDERKTGTSIEVVDDFVTTHPRLLLVGSPNYTIDAEPSDFEETGRVDLYTYNTGTSSLDHRAQLEADNPEDFQHFGSHTSVIDDFDGDGNTDIIVGGRSGKAWVFLGGALTSPLTPDIVVEGTDADGFGQGVYGGDIGGDSRSDIVVTALTYGGVANTGRVYVFFGSEFPPATLDESDADIVITGDSFDELGADVAVGHDVTGDLIPDLIITSAISEEMLVFAGPLYSGSLSPSNATATITGLSGVYSTRRSLVSNGDITGNEVNDILVGESQSQGRATMIEGGSHLTGTLSLDELGIHALSMRPDETGDPRVGHAVLMFDSAALSGDYRIALGAPDTELSIPINLPGDIYTLDLVRGVYRERGQEAESGGLGYTGSPNAGLAFDYDPSSKQQYVFVGLSDAQSKLFRTETINATTGITAFADLTNLGFTGPDDFPTTDMRGGAAADFDNDGDIDFYVAAAPGELSSNGARLYEKDDTTLKFTDVSDDIDVAGPDTSLKVAVQNGTAVSWADYDLDGQIDLLLTHKDASEDGEPPVLLRNRMGESNDFEDVSSSSGIELTSDPGLESWAHAWGDYDNDGDVDLFTGNEDDLDSSRLYVNNLPTGSGFTENASGVLGVTPEGDRSAVWVDLNDDGLLDLLLGETLLGGNGVFINRYGTSFVRQATPGQKPIQIAAPVDYDYDGFIDVVSIPTSSGFPSGVHRTTSKPDGNVKFSRTWGPRAKLDFEGDARFVLAEDFGGASQLFDGDIDILLGRDTSTATPTDLLLQNLSPLDDEFFDDNTDVDRPSPNKWIGIILRGGGGNNGSGVGARVTVSYTNALGSVEKVQVVDGGSLRASQMPQVLRFGLGEYSGTVDVDIDWPDGATQSLTGLASNQIHEIEDDTSPSPLAGSESASLQLHPDLTIDFVFTWQTDYASKRELSGVRIRSVGGSVSCYLAEHDIGHNSSVTYTMKPVFNATGVAKFQHTLVWNRDCEATCSYQWKAYAKTLFSTRQESTTWKKIVVPVCVQE